MSEMKAIVPESERWSYENLHFAPAISHGGVLRCSGQLGTRGAELPEDPAEQFAAAFENVGVVLAEGGASWSDVVEMTTFHVGLMEHLQVFMQVRDSFVDEPWPAWTAVGVSELAAPGALVEIKVTARLPG